MAEFYKMNPAKWDNGTADLSLEQEAAYLRIVNAINKGDEPCPANPHVLAGLFRCNTQRAKRLLSDLIYAGKVWVEDGKIYNEHAMSDVRVRCELRVTRQRVGKLGGAQKHLNASKPLETNKPELPIATPREEKRRREEPLPDGNGTEAKIDPEKVLFDSGVKLLCASGISEAKARANIGRWKKAHGSEAVLVALGITQRSGATEPVGYVEKVLRNAAKGKPVETEDGRVIYDDAFGGGPIYK